MTKAVATKPKGYRQREAVLFELHPLATRAEGHQSGSNLLLDPLKGHRRAELHIRCWSSQGRYAVAVRVDGRDKVSDRELRWRARSR